MANIDVAQLARVRILDTRRRRNHAGLRRLKCGAGVCRLHIRSGRYSGVKALWHGSELRLDLRGRRNYGWLYVRQLRNRMSCGHRYRRRRMVPRNHIRNRNIVFELHIRRADDGLLSIVGFRRNRNNRLRRERRIRCLLDFLFCSARIQRRQVIVRLVINDVVLVKNRRRNHLWTFLPKLRHSP